MNEDYTRLDIFTQNIKNKGLSIYDKIEIDNPDLWIPTPELEKLLNKYMQNTEIKNEAIRTRSKVIKRLICQALGYKAPNAFKRTQPRFPGQRFDVYVQKSNNLQVWNEELSASRRYVLVRIKEIDSEYSKISRVKVVNGEHLAKLDTTGTLTQKYQAQLLLGNAKEELISQCDTQLLHSLVSSCASHSMNASPTDIPIAGQILPIREIFQRLQGLIDTNFPDIGSDQERNRGAVLHKLVCKSLGYSIFHDNGQFPDVRHQLLEVKLQTSPTIDLGLICPNSEEALYMPLIGNNQIRHCDVRYALFYAKTDGQNVSLTNLFLVTGKDFFQRFRQFQGNRVNKKLQIPLPSDFFDL